METFTEHTAEFTQGSDFFMLWFISILVAITQTKGYAASCFLRISQKQTHLHVHFCDRLFN